MAYARVVIEQSQQFNLSGDPAWIIETLTAEMARTQADPTPTRCN